MIVDVSGDGEIALLDAKNFHRLSLELPAAFGTSPAAINAVLSSLGSVEGEGHVWMDVTVLKGLGPGDVGWHEGFEVMITQAAKHGWTRANDSEVRVHVSRKV
jgi:hypothetical protein